ncbi:hypothetical protein GCM10008967_21520 [Bacillus carboniphilus]|uniref:Uncharacterized protein n=1 Tax=Bacillus carboniphilus TaxID=86663 RepID=A0ABP3G0A0_9BACI
MKEMHNQHEGHHQMVMESDLKTTVTYKDNKMKIEIIDKKGDSPELELTHEKLMHLIIVSENLNEFYHVHPDQVGPSTFESVINLSVHRYRVFVDINPKGKHYLIKPNEIQLDSVLPHYNDTALKVDQQMTKQIKGKEVQLVHDPFEVRIEVELKFTIKNGVPQPYLGALGHVVIIDEKVEEFIHVHPSSETDTVFIAQFS